MTNLVAKIEKQIRIQLSGEVMDNSKEHDKMIKHYQVIEDSDVSSLSPLVAPLPPFDFAIIGATTIK